MTKKFLSLVLLVIAFFMLTVPAFAQYNWDRVGGDPCTLSRAQAIDLLSIPPTVKVEVLKAHQSGNYQMVNVPHGIIYHEMVFGQGKIRQDVNCSWRFTSGPFQASRVIVNYDGYKYIVDRYTRCSNFCWYRVLLPAKTPTSDWEEFHIVPVAPPPAQPEIRYTPPTPNLPQQSMGMPTIATTKTDLFRVDQKVVQPPPTATATTGEIINNPEFYQWQAQQQQMQQQQQQQQQ